MPWAMAGFATDVPLSPCGFCGKSCGGGVGPLLGGDNTTNPDPRRGSEVLGLLDSTRSKSKQQGSRKAATVCRASFMPMQGPCQIGLQTRPTFSTEFGGEGEI